MKISKIFGFIAISAMILPAFTSCKSDEPNGGGPSGGTGGGDADKAVLNFDGQRLTSVGYYQINYDDQGRVSSISSRYDDDIEIDYTNGTIDLDEEKGSISFNSNGYVTSLVLSWDETDNYGGETYRYQGTGTANFNYSNGYLTSFTTASKETETNVTYNETYNWETSYKTTITWQSNNLVASVNTGWDSEDGDKEYWTENYVITYGDETNKFQQYPYYLAHSVIAEEPIDVLACVGLFGKGPAQLPEMMSEVYEDDDYTYDIDFEFTLNSNGAISQEKANYNETNYSYSASSKAFSEFTGEKGKKSSVRGFFFPKRAARK